MSIFILVLSVLFMCVGLIGCFVNRVPGPILTFIGILLFNYGTDYQPFEIYEIILCGIAVILTKVLDKFIPKLTTKISAFGKGGKWGCTIGSLIGMLFIMAAASEKTSTGLMIMTIIVSLIILPFITGYLGELISKKNAKAAVKPALAAFTTYLIGTLIKLSVCVYCIYTTFASFD